MKKTLLTLFFLMSAAVFAQVQNVTSSISPNPFEETNAITITINGSSINETTWGIAATHELYMWAWANAPFPLA